jgi:UDP-N-acetylglucosamine 2-epimerase (non-hydrolysing)
MRTGRAWSPFPEEINRRIITQCATIHFAATTTCEANLLSEGVRASTVHVTGNTVVDALLEMRGRLRRSGSRLPKSLMAALDGRRLVLATTHRRESFGAGLLRICHALRRLSLAVEDLAIVVPVHPNPNVTGPVRELLGTMARIHLIQPYREFVELMDRACLILTDSGGLQEEAPTFAKPVLVLRDTTERPEGIEAGIAKLVGTDTDAIVSAALGLLTDSAAYARMAAARNPYGDGFAADRIATRLRDTDARVVTDEVDRYVSASVVGGSEALA